MQINHMYYGAIAVAVSLTVTGSAMGQSNASELLPQDQASWINSIPLSTADLKGKAAFLYFYEET